LTLQYDKVVIGGDLPSVLYAFINELPLIANGYYPPFRFDYLDPAADVGCVKLTRAVRPSVTTHSGLKVEGCPKILLWERLLFLMNLRGQVPLPKSCDGLRSDDDRLLCYNSYAKIAEIQFEDAVVIIPPPSLEKKPYVCYDWVAFNRGGKHEIDYIETQDDFVHQIWFYPSDRIDGNTGVKDACLVSHLTAEEVESFDYSETMARFKMLHEMKNRGMRGLYNGLSPTGKPKYYKFKTSFIGRERIEKSSRTFAPQKKNIQHKVAREEDLLKDLASACVGYDRFLKYL